MNSEEIRDRFIKFFLERGHKLISSASLVPVDDSSVLFTTAGMQPLIPYLLGLEHPHGRRLVNVQKCVRTQDIDEVGDKTHDTFFEMLGNWSLGDYFKRDAIRWSYELLTDEKKGFALDPARLYVTCFEGDSNAPKDEESAKIWEEVGIPKKRIYFLPKEKNWWSPGENGPCGPDTEMFYDVTSRGLGDLSKDEYLVADQNQQLIEVWNDVFMEYEKKNNKIVGKLSQKNVDTGAGLERLAMVLQKKDNIFETDLFSSFYDLVKKLSNDERKQRIISDHLRTSVFLIGDGVRPGNTDRGYILRRLLRRAVFYTDKKEIEEDTLRKIILGVVSKYDSVYENLKDTTDLLVSIIKEEINKFRSTIERGLKEFEKLSPNNNISGEDAFKLFTSYGFPIDMTLELAHKKNVSVDEKGFWTEMNSHKEKSRSGAQQKFSGGLINENPKTIKLHTATHLLQAALREVLGVHVLQRGSNITEDRLRFDFSHPDKVSKDDLKKIENRVNDYIRNELLMRRDVMSVEEAKNSGTIGIFDDKYAQVGGSVSVYSATNTKTGKVISREICGGPHVKNTNELGHFRLLKEESVASGVRRIKAIVE